VQHLDPGGLSVAVLGQLADPAAARRGDGDFRPDEERVAGDEDQDYGQSPVERQILHRSPPASLVTTTCATCPSTQAADTARVPSGLSRPVL
jgi:hypothetical protein